MNKKILVTGAAGFIGFHLVKLLLLKQNNVIGIDNINDYYDVDLKIGRLKELGIYSKKINYNQSINSEIFDHFKFIKIDLIDKENIAKLFSKNNIKIVINLAAQTGVRFSLVNPYAYTESNVSGFLNILENCRNYKIEHLVFASSSSVYGLNETMPYSINANVDHPISLYAATKKANELMAHSYSYLFNLPVTGLRFFTVYGEWGRPDMSYFIFAKSIYEGKALNVFNNGEMERDFTYVEDVVKGIMHVKDIYPKKNYQWTSKSAESLSTSIAPYKLYNLGNNKPVKLLDFIREIEKAIGIKANINFLPIQPGDVVKTWADISESENAFNYKPETTIDIGIPKFINWFKKFYNY
ncbi:MAG: NAD-dependent epimerase [Ignavibacteriales bacterium CG12_big_fil_rev_8_21_14_0_65_30_8]|nr:MAG: NAD-dependent epimerase [Ignavibacteriales bacterium CG12_big_fil_rev_8_21_14_0_65_30_8]